MAAIALVEILVGYAQVAVVGKRPPKSAILNTPFNRWRNHCAPSAIGRIAARALQFVPQGSLSGRTGPHLLALIGSCRHTGMQRETGFRCQSGATVPGGMWR